jgi:type VI secretion system protein ImpL
VTRDDFARLFGPGGLLEDFFQKNLAPYVDTSSKPWKFKKMGEASMGDTSASLIQFQRAQTIREVFFRGAAVPSVKLEFKPVALDTSITQLVIDIDGQVLKYSHGPQVPTAVQWPGPKGTSQVRLQVSPPGASGSPSAHVFEGPWALFRLLDRAQIQPTSQPEKMLATFNLEGRRAQFEIISGSVQNPMKLPELEQFRCPGRL